MRLTMAYTSESYSIEFPDWYDDLAEFEHEAKGHLSEVAVRFADGSRFLLSVMDPTRLQQDLDAVLKSGGRCLVEPNLIVVPAVTRVAIQEAVRELVRDGFFERLGRAR